MRRFLATGGYTLVDALLQLAVLLLFSQLILFYSVWFKQVEKNYFQSEAIDWQMFSVDLESNISAVSSMTEQANQSGIRFEVSGVEYDVECYSSAIRKQKNRLGHEVMLVGIKSCKFEVTQDRVLVYVEFNNGHKEERTYEVFNASK